MVSRLSLFPLTTEVSERGHLVIGGCDTLELATEFGTPLYLFDEFSLRRKCAECTTGFTQYYSDATITYACKAFMNKALALIVKEEGLGLDVVSAGELNIAHSVGFPLDKVYFNGNNKSAEEVGLAVKWRVGRIVVDNFHELDMLSEIARKADYVSDILLRLSPGVDPHTHQYVSTGIVDSKFGFYLSDVDKVVAQAMADPNLNLVGLHFHIGSLILEVEPYEQSIVVTLNLAAEMRRKYGFELRELNIGGGFAVQYCLDSPALPIVVYAEAIAAQIIHKCNELKMPLPRLVVEPGRVIVGQAGVALYEVGVIKDIPGIRRYVLVDGGMADNVRPALYGSKYEALVAGKALADETERVTIAGKFCESGDILVQDINLPPVIPGDIIAIPDCGAYCLSMASNYNTSLKPAVVLVGEGKARLIRRRETFADLACCDIT